MLRRFFLSAYLLAALSPVRAQTTATLVGRVIADSTRQPVSGARITLTSDISTESDSLGNYRFSNVSFGSYRVTVRRLGFAPFSTTIEVEDDAMSLDLRLTALALDLPEVEVRTTLLDRKLSGFVERRRFGIGRFLDEDDIRKGPGTRLSEKVRSLPGLVVIYPRNRSSNEVRIASTRGKQSILLQGGASGPCYSAIMLDGVPLTEPFHINTLDVGEVAAIEWYSGPAQLPAQFNTTGNNCGLMMIWTK